MRRSPLGLMPTVEVTVTVPATLAAVEQRWYDTSTWPEWVDGLDTILEVSGGWPAAGARVRWRSNPDGRGEVTERVVEHTPAGGVVTDVHDDTVEGRQTVSFTPVEDGVLVSVRLAYRVSRRSPLTPLLERLFVNSAFRQSLATTLGRFAAGL